MDVAVPADHRLTIKENEKRNNYLDFARELQESMEHAIDADTNNWCSREILYGLVQGLKDLERG